MVLSILLLLGSPITWLLASMAVIAWSRFARKTNGKPVHRSRYIRTGTASAESFGSAFMFLSMAYRPNHSFIAKAQIQQQEDTDEDDQGGPDTARKHFLRQLRRIRRGEPVDQLILRLE